MVRNLMRSGWGRRFHALAMSLVLSASVAVLGGTDVAFAKIVPEARIDTIAQSQLPAQGRDMMTLILRGGPFRYDKDGTVFGNRERILPLKTRGFYREYTVKTPGERTRGARRIVCGGTQPVAPEACYYTDDHYASFRRIVQ
jgi:ribonuclease T1